MTLPAPRDRVMKGYRTSAITRSTDSFVNISGVFGGSVLQVIHFILSFILSCFFRCMVQAS